MQTTVSDMLGESPVPAPDLIDEREAPVEAASAEDALEEPIVPSREELEEESRALRLRIAESKVGLENLESQLRSVELALVDSTPEPTLQEVNAYMRRLDVGEQAERAEIRALAASRGMRLKRNPHPPLFTTS